MPPKLIKVAHYMILGVLFVGGLGPTIAQFSPFVPVPWFAAISHVVAVCAGLTLYLSSSPLTKPLLETKDSQTLYRHADQVARVEISKGTFPPEETEGYPPIPIADAKETTSASLPTLGPIPPVSTWNDPRRKVLRDPPMPPPPTVNRAASTPPEGIKKP